MKRFSLLMLCAALFFFAGCGDGGSDYDKYGDTGDSTPDKDSADTVPDKDSSDTADDPADSDTNVQPDEDGEEDDEEKDDSDADTAPVPENFWATCEGIIACSRGCTEGDSECVGECYGNGDADGQLNYRRWRECFDNECAEEKTAECSAEKCAEWDELCNVAEAFEYKVSFPAPYGHVEFAGEFSFILNNVFPSSESDVVMSSFAKGNIASMQLGGTGIIVSFVRTGKDERDGEVVDVYQAPYDVSANKPGNPVVILRIKKDAAVVGSHTAGVADESEARFIVGDMDEQYKISCYHAFGIGSFKIDKAEIKNGSEGRLKLSGGTAELFSPQNIPELGGDARETLGVEACSLIQ
ncbi:hypothetical protein J5681_10110 [bacterium]|nr:hypothetical protein [bacterium]